MIFKFRDYRLRYFNLRILLYVGILCFAGVQFVGSATALTADSSSTMTKQLLGILMGVVLMIIVSLIDYHFLLKNSPLLYLASAGLLLFIRFFGATYNNSTRWIELSAGGFNVSLQPSEFIKIFLIVVFAAFFSRKASQEKISKPLTVLEALGMLLLPMGLILLQPDLSTSLVVLVIFAFMFFAAGVSFKWVGAALGTLGAGIAAVLIYVTRFVDRSNVPNYQIKRIIAWLDPTAYPDIVYQQTNSVMAIGNGGLSGKGLFNTTLETVKSGNYLSEQDTDFIFAVVGEEVGFIGSCAIIGLLLLLIMDCLYMAYRAKDLAGRLICVGFASLIGFQSFVNISVATGIIPNTGLPLPFISAGLSSLISLFMGLGLVLNVGMQREVSRSSQGRYDS